MSDDLIIRKMTAKDIDRVSRIEEQNFSRPWSREAFETMLNSENALYMVAQTDDKVVGNCGVIVAVDEGDICNVAVDKDYRGRGIGEELVKTVMKTAAEELGVRAFTLEVRASNAAAIRLYEKIGFVSEGVRPKFYSSPVEDAVIYWKR